MSTLARSILSIRQKALRFFYPLIRRSGRSGPKGTILINYGNIAPVESFFLQKAVLNTGQSIDFSAFSGKKILIVNTASNCGHTGQYAALQTLHARLGHKLAIFAFPSNDFKEQEKGSDDEIASFCRQKYGITFPIARKGRVIKSGGQQPVYAWLTNSTANGWCDHEPDWNFGKYLVDEKGVLTHYFGPSVSPLEKVVLDAVSG